MILDGAFLYFAAAVRCHKYYIDRSPAITKKQGLPRGDLSVAQIELIHTCMHTRTAYISCMVQYEYICRIDVIYHLHAYISGRNYRIIKVGRLSVASYTTTVTFISAARGTINWKKGPSSTFS